MTVVAARCCAASGNAANNKRRKTLSIKSSGLPYPDLNSAKTRSFPSSLALLEGRRFAQDDRSGYAPPDRRLHPIREEINLIECRVHVGRDPKALKFWMNERRRDDVVLRQQPRLQLPDVHSLHRNHTNRPALLRPDRRQHLHPIARCQESLRPAISQHPQPRNLSLGADRAMKRQRDRD